MYGFGFGGGHWGGAVADLLAVPFADGMLVALPDGVAPACAASVADNVADAFRHVEPHLPALLERDPEAGLLIVSGIDRRPASPPSIALYAGIIAVALGARDVRFADRRAHVRAHAERLGLQAITPSQLPRASPAQLVIDVSGTGGLRAALRATAPDGVCSSAGGLLHSVRLPVARMYASNVTLHLGRTHARAVIPKVLALIADGRLRPETVTTHEASIDDAPAAIHAHLAGQDIKTVLVAA
jgi:alcohol dehydrogenase